MSALDGFYSTWNKARETFGQGTPDDGSQFDGSSRLMEMKASVDAAAPDDRWQGSGSQAYAAANKEHASVYEKLAELDKKMAGEVKKAADVVNVGRTNLDTSKGWVESMVNCLPAGLSDTDRENKLIPIAKAGITKVDDIVKAATDDMTTIKGNVDKLKGEYETIQKTTRFGPAGNKEGKEDDKPDIMSAWQDRADGELLPEDVDGLVQDALNGNKDAASKVDEILNTIDPRQLQGRTDPTTGSKIPAEKLNPVQAELVGRMQQRMEDMSLNDLSALKEKLGDKNDILTNAMNVMSDPDVNYPRHGDAEVVSPNGGIPTSGWDVGGKDDLPSGVRDALGAKLDLSGPAHSDAPGVDVHFGDTDGARNLMTLSDIIGDGDPKFQQGSELDRSLMSRGQEILAASPTGGNEVVQRIFETAGHDKVIAHDMFTKNQEFLEDVLTNPWSDDGKAASTLTDWIKQDANSPDPELNRRAGETARVLADYMGTHKTDLLDMTGFDSLGKENPLLTQSLANAMTPYLDEIAGRPSDTAGGLGLNPTTGFGEAFDGGDAKSPKAVDLLTVLNTDDEAARIINARSIALQNDYINDFAQSVIDNPNFPQDATAIDAAGKLKGISENALISASNDVIGDGAEAKERVGRLLSGALDMAGNLPGPTGTAVGISSPLFKEFITSFETDKPADITTPTRSSISMQAMLANSFIQAGLGPQEGIDALSPFDPDRRNGLDVPRNPNSTEYNDFASALRNYLDNISRPVQTGIGAYNQAYRDALPET
ncbi:hypothetical protein H7J87_05885 [Mycolicibacterium wolinskyi]|uniref:TPR repeat region-containing protein n=1 Tax=Mycolicibacterium TaxID=1866885 RepID=UPI001A9912C4|nr:MULTISPECIES: EspA/EspE family type VII secretion system effector [Mycolicibacterium]MCV7284852.1 hypothetical protein [Mycolicibacterium wolinskyi]MCV7297912.1 hypothetical protein [Mycolicibacterium goodii]